MVYLWDAVAECLFQRFERQRLIQVLTELPRFDHAREDIHEQAEVDETPIETHISNICHPDLIWTRDLKVFEQVAPRFLALKRLGCLTRTLDGDQEIVFFHQPSNASGSNNVSPDAGGAV